MPSGKSTTLKAIAGLESVSRGNIDVDGTGGIGICPQQNVLWDEMTVKENIGKFLGYHIFDYYTHQF